MFISKINLQLQFKSHNIRYNLISVKNRIYNSVTLLLERLMYLIGVSGRINKKLKYSYIKIGIDSI